MRAEFTLYFQLLIVLVADYLLGDPRFVPHPVRLIGQLCVFYERKVRERFTWVSMKNRGLLAFSLVLLTTMAALSGFFLALQQIAEGAAYFGALVVCFFCIAAGDLVAHSNKVYDNLKSADIVGARQAVSLMVGRDTATLDDEGVSRACVESVSENMVDGITAPLFWAFIGSIGGAFFQLTPLISAACCAMAYKAINTMDSMYGYKNEQYLEFGWCAARADDLANFLPARLSGVCMIVAAYLLRFDGRNAARIYKRDRLRSSSPNSGHSEAAAAGALNIELGGPSLYFGQVNYQEYIGEGLGRVRPGDIKKANKLVIVGSLLFFGLCCVIHLFLVAVLR